jgi:hypothetical protein
MYKQLDLTGQSAGTFSSVLELDRLATEYGKGGRDLIVLLDVSAVAGASPNITINIVETVTGNDAVIASLTTPLTGVGTVLERLQGIPNNCRMDVVASGTITASSLAFTAFCEAVK